MGAGYGWGLGDVGLAGDGTMDRNSVMRQTATSSLDLASERKSISLLGWLWEPGHPLAGLRCHD